MRMAVRTCYDFLREHQRNRENTFTELTTEEDDWLERVMSAPEQAGDQSDAARQLVAAPGEGQLGFAIQALDACGVTAVAPVDRFEGDGDASHALALASSGTAG